MTLKHTDHRQPQMHKWFPLIALLLLVLASPVWADYTVDFVRISCVPDAQFLDVEYRGIHNPAITALTEHGTVRPDVLARHGFFSPSKLSYECSLPDSKYTIIATQTGWSERGMCGAAPEIFLSLQRNGEPLLERVVFGSSCFGNPLVTREAYLGFARIPMKRLTNVYGSLKTTATSRNFPYGKATFNVCCSKHNTG